MKLRTFLLCTGLLIGSVQAADHIDSPAAVNDPLADLLDFYIFVNPNDPDEAILALTMVPFASGDSQYSDALVYSFFFENEPGLTARIDCSFSNDQIVTCTGPGDSSVSARVGEIGTSESMRVFSGLREDPFFFDFDAVLTTLDTGEPAFRDPGVDFLAGANVLSLVVGVDSALVSPEPESKAHFNQKVWVASERVAGDGLNGGFSGSWYNPDDPGQGWVIEVVNNPPGTGIQPKNHAVEQFVVYFYGYQDGAQLWLAGNGPGISGGTATVDVIRTGGAGFGDAFDGDDVARETVGEMTFVFDGCTTGTVTFTPTASDLTEFTTPIERLSNISALDCNLFTAGQIDREGRAAVNTALIPSGTKDAYNAAGDPTMWADMFTEAITGSLEFTDGLDGIEGNLLTGDAATLASVLVDDRLQVDLSIPECGTYLALEAAALGGTEPTACGGRTLEADVTDVTLTAVVSGFEVEISDNVDSNDVPYLSVFPFLAPPH
ncbi:MAG: DUF4331 family protein [Xanthomonadales bacterium]|nr:DUF4331 family protein [Xanthomonadales bacterium]